jgi:hypothetical protein
MRHVNRPTHCSTGHWRRFGDDACPRRGEARILDPCDAGTLTRILDRTPRELRLRIPCHRGLGCTWAHRPLHPLRPDGIILAPSHIRRTVGSSTIRLRRASRYRRDPVDREAGQRYLARPQFRRAAVSPIKFQLLLPTMISVISTKRTILPRPSNTVFAANATLQHSFLRLSAGASGSRVAVQRFAIGFGSSLSTASSGHRL